MTYPVEKNKENGASGQPGVIRTALLIAGSAFFGGLTVVLWNRKMLARLREAAPAQEGEERDGED